MIDTVALTMNKQMFEITRPDYFSRNAKDLLDSKYHIGGQANMRCVQNPTRSEYRNGIYKPRLTLTKRARKEAIEIVLKIELSLPKFLYRNNFMELCNKDFYIIVSELRDVLEVMGVETTHENIINSLVSIIHYSRNILLPNGLYVSTFIRDFARVDVNERLDLEKTSYRNGGQAIRYHANSFEFIIYDKWYDLIRFLISDKRSIEGESILQHDFVSLLKSQKRLEILRMEARLNSRQKIRSLLRSLGIQCEPTFGNLFSENISTKVLSHYLSCLIQADLPLFHANDKSSSAIYSAIRVSLPHMSRSKKLKLLGTMQLVEELGVRGFRNTLKDSKDWYKIKRDIEKIELESSHSSFEYILNRINEQYKPVKELIYEAN